MVQICEEWWTCTYAVEDVQTIPHRESGGLLWAFSEIGQ
jgi:hypothetical protein